MVLITIGSIFFGSLLVVFVIGVCVALLRWLPPGS
jgi:hypothetical protein